MTLVKISEFAEIMGCSQPNITNCIKRKDPRVVIVYDENGKRRIHLEESQKRWHIRKVEPRKKLEAMIKEESEKPKVSEEINKSINKTQEIPNSQGLLLVNADLDHTQAKVLQVSADAIKKTMEYQLIRRKLIEREYVDHLLPNMLSTFKNRVELVPKRVCDVLAHNIKDKYNVEVPIEALVLDVRGALEKEFYKLLVHLTNESQKILDNMKYN